MIGGRLLTAALALLLSGVVVAAQDAAGPLPERRITVEPGVDFYGSDLRSIFGTTLPICRDTCMAESACTAFTFNAAASACFLKSDDGARTAFPAALSATLAPQPEGLAARAAARAAELGFLPAERLAAAREAALSAGFPPVNPVAEAQVAADLAAMLAEINRTDAAAAWAALSAHAAGAEVEDSSQRSWLRDLAVSAGINAFLRAGTDAEAGEAARLTGVALEAADEGRASLDALRLAELLAPGPAIAAAVARAEGLYGFRVVDRQVDFEAASPRACFDFSEPLAGAGTDYADFVRIDAGTYPVEARDRQLCIDGLAHGSRLPGDAARGAAVRRGRAAARLGRAGSLCARPDARGPLRRPRLRPAEERGGLGADRIGQHHRGGAPALPGRDAQRGDGDRQRRLRQPADGERGNPRARHPGRAGVGGDRRACAGVEPRRDDDPAHGRRGRRAGARALRADRTRRRRAVRRGLGGLGDAVVRGDRSRAGGLDRRGRAACLPPRPVGRRRARGRRGDAACPQQRRAWPGCDRRARAHPVRSGPAARPRRSRGGTGDGRGGAGLRLPEPRRARVRPLRPGRRRAAGAAAGRRLRDDRTRRLPAGGDGVRHGSGPGRPGPGGRGASADRNHHPRGRGRVRAVCASRPGCRRPDAGAADRRGRSHRRLAARGPCRPGGSAAGDGGVPGRGLHAGAGRSRADPA